MKMQLLLTLSLILAIGMPCFAQELPSPIEQPLSPAEIREGILRTEQLIVAWETVGLLQATVLRMQEQYDNTILAYDNALQAAEESAAIIERELQLQIERADFYENAYKTMTKGRSKKCWIAKIFTLGLARCQ